MIEKQEMTLPGISNSSAFAEEIEAIVIASSGDYIDAVLEWCTNRGVEIEYAADLIRRNPVMRSKLLESAENLNFVKRTSDRLPI